MTPSASYVGAIVTQFNTYVGIEITDEAAKMLEYLEASWNLNTHPTEDNETWELVGTLEDWARLCERYSAEDVFKEIDEILTFRFPFIYARVATNV